MRLVIALSGPIAVGKSAVIQRLAEQFSAHRISTRELIQSKRPEVPTERAALQTAGVELDVDTDGRWVAESLPDRCAGFGDQAVVVIDSVRIKKQVGHLRSMYPGRVWHLHLTASFEVLKSRFLGRKADGDPATYEAAVANDTERQVDTLARSADYSICTDNLTPEQTAELAAARIHARLQTL
jgi:adenylosuccinate synthase